MRVLLVDNYDSFTHNLYQLLAGLGAEVVVARNDALDLAGARALQPTHLVISPGPGRPENARDFGICGVLLHELSGRIPVLGVCLGHQGIVHLLGGEVVHAPRVVHGHPSPIRHDGQGLFAGLPNPMHAMRYHSLAIRRESVPPELRVTAESVDDGVVMAVAHNRWPLFGVQFHPESIGTPEGERLLANFLAMEVP